MKTQPYNCDWRLSHLFSNSWINLWSRFNLVSSFFASSILLSCSLFESGRWPRSQGHVPLACSISDGILSSRIVSSFSRVTLNVSPKSLPTARRWTRYEQNSAHNENPTTSGQRDVHPRLSWPMFYPEPLNSSPETHFIGVTLINLWSYMF